MVKWDEKMITIYWYCHEMPKDEKFVADSLSELAQNLRREPIKLNISIKALQDESDLAENVIAILKKLSDKSYTFNKCAAYITDIFSKFDLITKTCTAELLVYCSSDSKIAKAALKEKPDAEWGANCGFFSAAYPPKDKLSSKFTIWHEALHLLGLDECYDENTLIRNCEWETCIMQHKPPKGVDKNWSSPLCDNLCDKNIKLLQELAKKAKVQKHKNTF